MIKTSLYDEFSKKGFQFKEELGFNIPLSFNEKEEYSFIRDKIGIIDNSSDAFIKVSGSNSDAFLESILPVNIEYLPIGKVIYTALFNGKGKTLALVWIMKDEECYYLISDNTKRLLILDHLNKYNAQGCVIEDLSQTKECIAVIGPKALSFLIAFMSEDLIGLPYLAFENMTLEDIPYIITRVGLTGEYEYRIYVDKKNMLPLYNKMIDASKKYEFEIGLCGKSIINTLMLEMKSINQALDMDDDTNFFDLGLHWMISFQKESDYVGKEELMLLKESSYKKKSYLTQIKEVKNVDEIDDKATIYFESQKIGQIIQKGYSYKVDQVIALVYLSEEIAWPGIDFEVECKNGKKANLTTLIPPLFITNTIINSKEE